MNPEVSYPLWSYVPSTLNVNLSLCTVKCESLETPYLDVKIWFPFSFHVPGTNPSVAACLTPSSYDLFAKSLPFVGVAKLINFCWTY